MAIGVQVTFDAHDPPRLAEFWALALDYVLQPPPEGFASWEDFARSIGIPEEQWDKLAAVVDPDGVGPRLLFQKVPEGKTAKNRVHLDVNAGAGAEDDQRRAVARAHVQKLVAAGGTVLREVDEATGWCLVMRDPEGNEFCVQ
jgi:hypothetical protein